MPWGVVEITLGWKGGGGRGRGGGSRGGRAGVLVSRMRGVGGSKTGTQAEGQKQKTSLGKVASNASVLILFASRRYESAEKGFVETEPLWVA